MRGNPKQKEVVGKDEGMRKGLMEQRDDNSSQEQKNGWYPRLTMYKSFYWNGGYCAKILLLSVL